MSASGSEIADYARQFLDGPGYEWGSPEIGVVAEFRRAMEAGGTIEEISARVRAVAAADFNRACQEFSADLLSG